MPRERVLAILALATVFALTTALALPSALAHWDLMPDGVGYVATAHNWIEGRGWVDPVIYTYFLEGVSPPVPAFAIRPPVFSLLLSAPIFLGADLTELRVLHVLWAAAIAASSYFAVRRLGPRPVALAVSLSIGGCIAWILLARSLLTEVTSVAVLLLFIGTAKRALSSVVGGVLLGVLTTVAYFTRPNLGLLLPALGLACVLDQGLRTTLRSGSLWAAALVFAGLKLAVESAVERSTGLPAFAHYAMMAETLDVSDYSLYQREYVGIVAFAKQNAAAILATFRANLVSWWSALSDGPFYLRAGWLALPAVFFALTRPATCSLTERMLALSAIGFTATAVATYGGFDTIRYPLQGFVCLAILDVLLLARVARRWRWGGWLPLAVVALVVAVDSAPPLVARAREDLASYLEHGARRRVSSWDGPAMASASLIDRNAIVASPCPWPFTVWCGSAGILIPRDLDRLEVLHAFLDEYHPGYLVTDGEPSIELLARSPRLRPLAVLDGKCGLYEVVDAGPESRPWVAPPPLAEMGARRVRSR